MFHRKYSKGRSVLIIDGYDSNHGYVHNGGLVGMYIFYPKGTAHEGRITNNTVQGRIRFFEDNTDRRAYCREYVGEAMSWNLKNSDNSADYSLFSCGNYRMK